MFLALYRLYVRLCGRALTSLCRSAFYRLGHGSVLLPPVRIRGEKFIEIGNNVFVGPNSWLEVRDQEFDPSGSILKIGDETSIANACTITAAQSVVIEARVLMAGNVYISDHSHAHDSRTVAIKDQGVTGISPVRICEGAWLGQNAVICPGVTVGRNAVVGANSVVRDDIPDFCVAVGAPARVIRKIDDQSSRPRELLETV
jgi:acetyltransferase-like isoleucine patch superfamily enzyme